MKNDSVNISELMEGFEKLCKTKGLRVTHQRTEVFKALIQYSGHPTTEDIFHQVRKNLKTISLDTIYRTLATFEQHGLITKVHHIDNATRIDHNLTIHHHLVCTKCGKIEDFYWPDFDRMKPPAPLSGWSQIGDKHVIINGLCSSCSKKMT